MSAVSLVVILGFVDVGGLVVILGFVDVGGLVVILGFVDVDSLVVILGFVDVDSLVVILGFVDVGGSPEAQWQRVSVLLQQFQGQAGGVLGVVGQAAVAESTCCGRGQLLVSVVQQHVGDVQQHGQDVAVEPVRHHH